MVAHHASQGVATARAARHVPASESRAVSISRGRITRAMLITIGVLTLASLLQTAWVTGNSSASLPPLLALFNLDSEANAPTWFSSLLLLGCSALLWAIGRGRRQQALGGAARWTGLALVFTLLSLDEMAGIHEMLLNTLRDVGGPAVLVAGITLLAGLGLVLLFASILRDLPGRVRVGLLLGVGVYVLGAAVLEAADQRFSASTPDAPLAYALLTTVEEVLEMVGLVMLLHTLMGYAEDALGAVNLSVTG
jgi:hypothetical protein